MGVILVRGPLLGFSFFLSVGRSTQKTPAMPCTKIHHVTLPISGWLTVLYRFTGCALWQSTLLSEFAESV